MNLTSPAPNNGSFGALHHILRNPSTVARVQGNKNDGNTTKVKASEFVKAVDNAACHKLCSFLPEKVMHNSSERCINKNLKSFPINILKIFCHLIFLSKLWLIVRNPRSETNMAVGPQSPTLLKSILSFKSEFLPKIYALFFQG